jgi:hypothetical protein
VTVVNAPAPQPVPARPGPAPTDAPALYPTGAPALYPTGAPALNPTGAPALNPTGAPAFHPAPPPGYVYAEPDKITAFFGRVGRRTPRWLAPVGLAACCAAASAYVLWANPTDIGATALPTCLIRLTTGFDCPGCGGTRALWFLLHGDLPAAAQHHLIAVFAAPFLIYAYIAWTAGVLFGRRLPKLRLSFRGLGIALGVWAAFTVLRNLPFEPFSWFYV